MQIILERLRGAIESWKWVEGNYAERAAVENQLFGAGYDVIGHRGHRLVLIVSERCEVDDTDFSSLCHGVAALASRYKKRDDKAEYASLTDTDSVFLTDVDFVFLTDVDLDALGGNFGSRDNVFFVKPSGDKLLGYLADRACVILLDADDILEQPSGLGKPVLVMGAETEAPGPIEPHKARFIGRKEGFILKEVASLLDDSERCQLLS